MQNRELAPVTLDELSKLKNIPTDPCQQPARETRTLTLIGPKELQLTPEMRIVSLGEDNERSLWRVDVEVPRGFGFHLPGRTSSAVPLDPKRIRGSSHGLTGHRPPGLGVTYLPQYENPIRQVRSTKSAVFGGVFPPDDRVTLTDTNWPWLLIGKIFTSDGTSGSGALVGNRMVLTAKHMRPNRSIAAGSWWMKFVPHYYDGTEPFGSSYISDTRWPVSDDPEFDYMVCRLYDPLGERLGYFGSQEYSDAWNGLSVWASIGYPSDYASGQRPALQLPAVIEAREGEGDGQVLETEADLWYGASGGPFWANFPVNGGLDPRIVAVVHGEFDVTPGDDDNSISGGAHMVHLIDWGRANWA